MNANWMYNKKSGLLNDLSDDESVNNQVIIELLFYCSGN